MKLLGTCLGLAVALLALAGCGKKEISSLDRKQAAVLESEADFALSIRDFSRAEARLVQATELCPDSGASWLNLGSVRMKLGDREGARSAYQRALRAFVDAAKADRTAAEPALQQVYVLALLGRQDDARALLDRLPKKYPDNRDIRTFIDHRQLDRILADAKFKEFAL